MKVFKLNDCDWVAAKSLEEAREWYMKESGVAEDECDGDEECDIETDGMVVEWDSLSDEDKENAQENIEIRDGVYVHKTFKWVIDNQYTGIEIPYVIATTEY